MDDIIVLQLEQLSEKYEIAKQVLPSVSISLRYLMVIVNETAAAFERPVPLPGQVISYMRSVPYLSLFINPE